MNRLAMIVLLLSSVIAAAAGQTGKAPDVGPGGFEMTTYYVGFLYKGAKWTPEVTPETQRLQDAHLANIRRMAEAGKLLVAGPFTDGGELRGLYVFKVATAEEAKSLVETDPAVLAGRLRFELHPWYAAKNITVTPSAPGEKPAK